MKTSFLGMVRARAEINRVLDAALAAVAPDDEGKLDVELPVALVEFVGLNKATEGLALSHINEARLQLAEFERALLGNEAYLTRCALHRWGA